MKIREGDSSTTKNRNRKTIIIITIAILLMFVLLFLFVILNKEDIENNNSNSDNDKDVVESIEKSVDYSYEIMSEELRKIGINIFNRKDLSREINRINKETIDKYIKAEYFSEYSTIENVIEDINKQIDRKEKFINNHLGWGSEYGYDENIFIGVYLYIDNLLNALENGVASAYNDREYPLELQMSQIRYSIFKEERWIDHYEYKGYEECLKGWFESSRPKLENIDLAMIIELEEEKIFDNIYKSNLSLIAATGNGYKYTVYIMPSISENNQNEWVILDVIKEKYE